MAVEPRYGTGAYQVVVATGTVPEAGSALDRKKWQRKQCNGLVEHLNP